MRFTDIFIRRPVLATVVSLLILLLGARAFFDLTVRQYPELQNTVIMITTSFPGADPNLMQGFIETSNVNTVTEVTNLITAQRAYEMNSKVIQASDEMLSTLNQMR